MRVVLACVFAFSLCHLCVSTSSWVRYVEDLQSSAAARGGVSCLSGYRSGWSEARSLWPTVSASPSHLRLRFHESAVPTNLSIAATPSPPLLLNTFPWSVSPSVSAPCEHNAVLPLSLLARPPSLYHVHLDGLRVGFLNLSSPAPWSPCYSFVPPPVVVESQVVFRRGNLDFTSFLSVPACSDASTSPLLFSSLLIETVCDSSVPSVTSVPLSSTSSSSCGHLCSSVRVSVPLPPSNHLSCSSRATATWLSSTSTSSSVHWHTPLPDVPPVLTSSRTYTIAHNLLLVLMLLLAFALCGVTSWPSAVRVRAAALFPSKNRVYSSLAHLGTTVEM